MANVIKSKNIQYILFIILKKLLLKIFFDFEKINKMKIIIKKKIKFDKTKSIAIKIKKI